MAGGTDRAETGQERGKFASGKMVDLSHPARPGDDSLTVWVGWYLELAVRGVRSAEVTGKIGRHLGRFQAWFAGGFGHDRVSAVTRREVLGWREHLAASLGRTLTDGRVQLMAPATVNNHLAHLSAFFTWTAVHVPRELLPHGGPTAKVELLRLAAPAPRALADAQVRTVKNVLDRIEASRKKNRSSCARDGVPTNEPYAAACPSDRNSTGTLRPPRRATRPGIPATG
jgi:hypothetical protein